MASPIVPSETLNKRILDYVLHVTGRGRSWWEQDVTGTALSRREELLEYRLRMEGRRSVASLYADAKNEPFEGASNIGVGMEAIFAEFLIPLLLANTIDLEPALQAREKHGKSVLDDLTTFHDTYHRFDVPGKRELVEYSTRDLLTVGGCFHKWPYGTVWTQAHARMPVWVYPSGHPMASQPLMQFDQGTGRMLPMPADPKTPKEGLPVDPSTGMPLTLGSLDSVMPTLHREGPELAIRPIESITWPEGETRVDPNSWDWLADDFEVSPFWLLGRQEDAVGGQLNLKELWRWLAIDPNELHTDPMRLASQLKPVKLRTFHGQYPATADGVPLEITALIAVDAKLLLGWTPSRATRRPYFNRQVWHSGTSPLGKGIPETVFSMRSAMDALLNQEIDAGNLYNNPPLLISDLAMLEDEDYETTGPGATWMTRDINGIKFLPTPVGKRDAVSLLDWLIVNTMRLWGVTDLSLNSPTNRLSPSPDTLGGTRLILNQGSIKFGHLTKRLSATDTQEYQYVHESFRLMLANPRLVTIEGESQVLQPKDREAYFSETTRLLAVGNGISTNPLLRQQAIAQFLQMAVSMQNPFIIGDLEAYKHLTDQWIESYGLDVDTKDPPALEQSRMFLELMQTPEGQAAIPAVMQQVVQAIQLKAQSGGQGNGRPGVRPAVAQATR